MQMQASVYVGEEVRATFYFGQGQYYDPMAGMQITGLLWTMVAVNGQKSGYVGNTPIGSELFTHEGQSWGTLRGFYFPMQQGATFTYQAPQGPPFQCVVTGMSARQPARVPGGVAMSAAQLLA